MWWIYIGLGMVVASAVVFIFALLAASSTDTHGSRSDSRIR